LWPISEVLIFFKIRGSREGFTSEWEVSVTC
jgi:hypothetical protein